PRAIWDWPIGYDDLEPHYTEAERLYGVAGHADEDFGPLTKPGRGYPNAPLPLHPVNEKLIAANRARGLRPFRLPLAIDPTRCLCCADCAGFVCPTGARSSSAQLVQRATREGRALRVLTHVEVERLLLNGSGDAGGAVVLDRASGRRTVYRARR